MNKLKLLNNFIQVSAYDIVFITETWLKPHFADALICPAGYTILRKDRLDKRGGGVLVLFKSHINIVEVNINLPHLPDIEYICIDVIVNRSIISPRFFCIYLPPNRANEKEIILLMSSYIKKHMHKASQFYLLGHYNMPHINWQSLSSSTSTGDIFLDFCNEESLQQHIDFPTHNSGSLLDLLLCDEFSSRNLNSIESAPPLTATCDHNIINFSLFYENISKPQDTILPYLCYKKGNYELINSKLDLINWEEVMSALNFNVQKIYDYFINQITSLVKLYVPTSQYKSTIKQPRHITRMAKQKKVLYRKLKSDPSLKAKYKALSIKYDKLVANWHEKVESRLCENGSASSFYKYANKKLNSRVIIPPMRNEDEHLLTDDVSKAELFNNYFKSVFINDNGKALNIPTRVPPTNFLEDIYISPETVEEVIRSLPSKTSKTPDDIPAILVKKCARYISKFLSMLFNLSIRTNQVPWQWKFSLVTPVHKKGSKNVVNNYRPIALTSVICRLLEKILSLRILQHLSDNRLLSSNQHGFLPGRSSSTQLMDAIHSWYESCNRKHSVNVVYTDLAKAFDKVSHPKLLEVVRSYGICGDVYNWLQVYLTNRIQSVIIKNVQSSPEMVTSGVPQGSVIGPLLFLLFIDDISSVSSASSTVCLFADDAKIYSTNTVGLQASLDTMSTFFKSRQLKLAPEKCELIKIGRTASPVSFEIDDVSIRHTDTVKDLGVWISNDLKWETHVNKISSLAYQRANHILRSFYSTNVWTLLKAYKTYIRPTLEYATTIWSPYLTKDKKMIERVQRYFTRKVCQRCRIPYASYKDRLSKLNIRSLEYRRVEYDLLFLYKIVNGLLDVNAAKFFDTTEAHHNTRSHDLRIRSKLPLKSLSQSNFFSNRCASIWNLLPSDIVRAPTYRVLRSRLKCFDLYTVCKVLF